MRDKSQDFLSQAGINAKLLKMCGIVLDQDIPRSISNFSALFAFLCLSFYSVIFVYFFFLFMGNLEMAMAFMSLVMSFVGGQARFSIFLWSRKRINSVLQKYETLWSQLTSSEQQKIHYFLNKSRLITFIFLSLCAFTILSYAIAFILEPASLDENNQTVARRLPYAFPVEVPDSPYYEIVYAVQMISVVNVGFTCVACDTTGMFLIMIVCGHFKVIQDRLVGTWKMESQNHSKGGFEGPVFEDEKTLLKVRSCISYHQSILKLCQEIEKLTNIIFFTGLVGTTYNLSLMGFKLTSDDPAKLTYAFQTAILVVQLFVYNWPPDLLVTHSSEISKAVWYSPWYVFSTKARKLLGFVIKQAHRPVRLTAGKLFYLSLENFASMISAAASFFTVLSTVK